MMSPGVLLRAEDALEFGTQLLAAAGVAREKAFAVAESMLAGSLRGIDSHGLVLLGHYLDQIRAGDVDPAAEGHIISESGGCLLYDAGHGFGAVTAAVCAEHAVRLARSNGISIVVAREASHFGIAARWAQKISDAGLIGMVMCDAGPQVAPWQGKDRKIGTNPICVSVPHPRGRGWLLDMATTTVALGKIEVAELKGQREIPAGWALDSEGRPTTDIAAAVKGLLMPLGGYKGSGLAVMVELLCGVLSGGAVATEIRGIRMHGRHSRVNHMFLAIDVSRFLPLGEFYARTERLIEELKSSAPAAGYSEILVAGDPEYRAEEERRRNGIALPQGAWDDLTRRAREVGVTVPPSRSLPK